MTFTLRPYQQEFDQAITEGHDQYSSVLGELATGLGKTVSFCKYAASWEHGRTLIVCPQVPLIGQAAKKIRKQTGIMPAIEQADLRSNEEYWARNNYVVASKQTLCGPSKRYKRIQDVGLLILDEAHYACTEIYAEMVNWYRDRGAKVLGVTATAKRHDGRAMGQVFDECVYQYGICEAIHDGWLVPIKVTCLQLEQLDLSDVDTTTTFLGRDFNQKQLNEKLENVEVIYEIAEAVAKETRGQKTAIYCSSVNEAQAVAELLVDNYGIRADWICADQKRCTDQHRRDALTSFCSPGGITHLANVGILTTGWDYPDLMCIVNARPTKSLPLYTQIMGRLTRCCEVDGLPVVDQPGMTDPDARRAAVAASRKPFGRMIDLVDNSLQHKLVTATDVLAGKWSLAVQERVKDALQASDEPMNIDQAAAEAKAALDKEEEERKRKQRAAREAAAKFRSREVDPFGGQRAHSRKPGRAHAPATSKQLGFLYWKMGRCVYSYDISKQQASRMIGMFKANYSVDAVRAQNRLKPKS